MSNCPRCGTAHHPDVAIRRDRFGTDIVLDGGTCTTRIGQYRCHACGVEIAYRRYDLVGGHHTWRLWRASLNEAALCDMVDQGHSVADWRGAMARLHRGDLYVIWGHRACGLSRREARERLMGIVSGRRGDALLVVEPREVGLYEDVRLPRWRTLVIKTEFMVDVMDSEPSWLAEGILRRAATVLTLGPSLWLSPGHVEPSVSEPFWIE